jgi:hypothetical protein
MLLTNEPWQDLGFSKRARSGAYFQRFRPRWKVDLEKRILQEMLVVFTAAYVVADQISSSNIPNVISAYLEKSDIVKALGYVSRDEGVQHLTRSIAKYRDSPIREWHTLILERVNPTSIPDKQLSARLLLGCIRFAQNAGGMVLNLRSHS